MMEKISISFIISYYNLDCFLLERAIQSILNISTSVDYEIIVIDDGTPNSKAKTCVDSFQNEKVKYIFQQNGGLSEARNTGIKLAKKDYIQFVDADDYLFQDGYLECLKLLERECPDILQFSLKKVWGKDLISHSNVRNFKFATWDGVQYVVNNTLSCAACSYCFKKEILGDIRFVKGIYQEDEEFSPRLFLKAKKFVKTEIEAYAYYQRDDSIIGNTDLSHINKRFEDLRMIIESMNHNARKSTDFLVKKALKRRADQLALAYIYNALELGPDFNYVLDKLEDMTTIGLYPLPLRKYSCRYILFNILSRSRLLLRFMRLIIKR